MERGTEEKPLKIIMHGGSDRFEELDEPKWVNSCGRQSSRHLTAVQRRAVRCHSSLFQRQVKNVYEKQTLCAMSFSRFSEKDFFTLIDSLIVEPQSAASCTPTGHCQASIRGYRSFAPQYRVAQCRHTTVHDDRSVARCCSTGCALHSVVALLSRPRSRTTPIPEEQRNE